MAVVPPLWSGWSWELVPEHGQAESANGHSRDHERLPRWALPSSFGLELDERSHEAGDGEHGGDGPGEPRIDAVGECVKSLVHAREAVIDLDETAIDLDETAIHPVEAAIHSVEAVIHAAEPLIDPSEALIHASDDVADVAAQILDVLAHVHGPLPGFGGRGSGGWVSGFGHGSCLGRFVHCEYTSLSMEVQALGSTTAGIVPRAGS